jgi:integrase
MKLTAKAVEKLRHEGLLHFRDIKDDGTPGLYLRILVSGEKRWIMRYKVGGRVRIGTFGDVGKISLADARTKAFSWQAIVRAGRDPAAEERRKALTERRLPSVTAFAAEFIERHSKPTKKSWREDERLIRHDVLPAIGDLRMDTVTRRDLVLFIDAIRDRGAPIVANRALAVTRRMFAFAVERGVIETSPFAGVRALRETPRAHILSDDELQQLWTATALGSPNIEPSTRMALRLLLLTGARASEVCGASWDEINIKTAEWVIPSSRTKNGREHPIPLGGAAMEIVHEAAALRTGQWLLPARGRERHVTPSGVLQAAQRILGPGVTVHDVRRTTATGLQRLGVRLEVTEAVLNHVSGTRAGVVGIYQRHDFSAEKRAALDAWARHILVLAAVITAQGVRELAGDKINRAAEKYPQAESSNHECAVGYFDIFGHFFLRESVDFSNNRSAKQARLTSCCGSDRRRFLLYTLVDGSIFTFDGSPVRGGDERLPNNKQFCDQSRSAVLWNHVS